MARRTARITVFYGASMISSERWTVVALLRSACYHRSLDGPPAVTVAQMGASEHPLADLFLRFLDRSGKSRLPFAADLEPKLRALLDGAKAHWPELTFADADNFVAYLAQKIPAQASPIEFVDSVKAEDLFLAWACWRGNETAISIVQSRYLARIPRLLAGQIGNAAVLEEVVQVLGERLLVEQPGDPPAIFGFTGQGSLAAWIRISALREAYRISGSGQEEVIKNEDHEAFVSAEADPEMSYMRAHYREEFQAAVAEAIGALDSRSANVLRYQAIDGLSLAEIAKIYGTHESTISRWVAKSRTEVLSRTRQLLMEKLQVDTQQLDSIIAVLRSQVLDLSIRRAFIRPKSRRLPAE